MSTAECVCVYNTEIKITFYCHANEVVVGTLLYLWLLHIPPSIDSTLRRACKLPCGDATEFRWPTDAEPLHQGFAFSKAKDTRIRLRRIQLSSSPALLVDCVYFAHQLECSGMVESHSPTGLNGLTRIFVCVLTALRSQWTWTAPIKNVFSQRHTLKIEISSGTPSSV